MKSISTKIVDGSHNPPFGSNEKTDYKMISSRNIKDGLISYDAGVRYLSYDEFLIESNRTKLTKDDLLMTVVGTIGKCCIYKDEENTTMQRSVSAISCLIDVKFLNIVIEAPYYQQFMNNNSVGTAQKGFYLNDIERLMIPVPPITEQNRIVSKIDSIIPCIHYLFMLEREWNENEDSLIININESILQHAIRGKLVPQDPNDEPVKIDCKNPIIRRDNSMHLLAMLLKNT